MKMYLAVLLLALAAICSNCKKSDVNIWMEINETYCADPWGTGESASTTEVENAVINYLENLEIEILDFELVTKENVRQECLACQCFTGRVIRIKVDESFKDELETENFEE